MASKVKRIVLKIVLQYLWPGKNCSHKCHCLGELSEGMSCHKQPLCVRTVPWLNWWPLKCLVEMVAWHHCVPFQLNSCLIRFFFHLLLDFKLNFLVETIGTPVLYSCVLHSWVHWKDIYLISFVHCDYCAKPSVNCLNCLAKNIFTVVHKSFCPWVGEKLCKAANTRWRCQPLACSRCKSLILWQSWISCPSLANISRKDSLLRM